MDPSQIKDEASLEVWLQGQTREVSVTIAHRAAMRGAPIFWLRVPPVSDGRDLTALRLSRSNLVSGVGGINPIQRIKDAAVAAASFESGGGFFDAWAYVAAQAAVTAVNETSDDLATRLISLATKKVAAAFSGQTRAADVRAAHAVVWATIRTDTIALAAHFNGQRAHEIPLWPAAENPLADEWAAVRKSWTGQDDPGWQFWTQWYDAALAGRPLLGTWDRHWALLTDIALIDPETWDKGPDAVNPAVAGIYERYTSPPPSPLAQAAITDFTFDAAFRVMRAVGFEDDLIHLRDPARVQSFLDDIEEARDGLTDFSDYASEASGQTNAPRVLVRAAENLLEELKRTKDTAHLRARRLITLGRHLEGFANEEPKRAELGETMAEMLDDNIAIVRDACRQHLGPSLAALSALDGLELGDIDPRDLIARLEAAIRSIDSADGATLVPLALGDVAMLRDMLDELRDLEASLGEARTDGFKERQRGKIARTAGQLGATLGRYTEKASKRAEDAGKALDGAVKWYRRWGSLSEVLDWLTDTFGSGGPPM